MNHSPVLINPHSQEKEVKEDVWGKRREGGEWICGKEDELDVMGLYLENTSIIHIQFGNLLRESWQVVRSD